MWIRVDSWCSSLPSVNRPARLALGSQLLGRLGTALGRFWDGSKHAESPMIARLGTAGRLGEGGVWVCGDSSLLWWPKIFVWSAYFVVLPESFRTFPRYKLFSGPPLPSLPSVRPFSMCWRRRRPIRANSSTLRKLQRTGVHWWLQAKM